MGPDVDLVKLLGEIRSSLPATMSIKQETVTLSLAGVAAAGASKAGVGLDTSGHPQIGNITISGSGHSLVDLSAYVDKLKVIPGVVNVVPVSNTADQAGMQFSLSLGLTDVLLSHRFDVSKNGGK